MASSSDIPACSSRGMGRDCDEPVRLRGEFEGRDGDEVVSTVLVVVLGRPDRDSMRSICLASRTSNSSLPSTDTDLPVLESILYISSRRHHAHLSE